MSLLPQPKLPHVTLPPIRSIPTIPHVGCAGATATTYVGQQFGNLPDVNAVLQIKALKKALEEQILALIKGQLPDLPRAVAYAAHAAKLVIEIAQLVATLNQVLSGVVAEAEAAISFVNQKVGEINAAKSAIENVPEQARSKVQRLMMQRYGRYVGELNAQAGRLQATIECIAS